MNHKTDELLAPALHFSVQLSPTPRGARLARLLGAERLRAWELPYGVADAAEHVMAELAANAAIHARVPGRDFRVALRVTDGGRTLRVEVTDTRADRLPSRRPPGLGLVIVEALAGRWGVALGPVPRKTVWAEWDLVAPGRGFPGSGGPGGLPKETKE
ncbi:ATP-binding protein [Streptomyces sp. CB03238]|uniref:ATP-binding protein n=1 Tax=Streptomyces sp. CB03238 TaxID=1907777 RepID=UPI000A105F0F|nr:ATP-binding protein [Streptomyces sp. CB03238]ORT59672.1 hypothetical protein BKD26_12255 [Streptomyces sp. CB03238]